LAQALRLFGRTYILKSAYDVFISLLLAYFYKLSMIAYANNLKNI